MNRARVHHLLRRIAASAERIRLYEPTRIEVTVVPKSGKGERFTWEASVIAIRGCMGNRAFSRVTVVNDNLEASLMHFAQLVEWAEDTCSNIAFQRLFRNLEKRGRRHMAKIDEIDKTKGSL